MDTHTSQRIFQNGHSDDPPPEGCLADN